MFVALFYLIFALILMYLTSWVGKHSYTYGYIPISIFDDTDKTPAFNFFYRIGSPIVFILILASILYAIKLDWIVKSNIYFIVIIYFVIRMLFHILSERYLLINWKYEILVASISIFISYELYINLILYKKNLIPDFTTLSNELWIIIIIFLYTVLNNIEISNLGAEKRKIKYITNRFNKFSNKYEKIVDSKVKDVEIKAVIYAIMIYESFNRYTIARGIEKLLFPIDLSKTLGVMQVKTEKMITDLESVEIGIEQLLKYYEMHKSEIEKVRKLEGETFLEPDITRKMIRSYNPNIYYIDEVVEIKDTLLNESLVKE